MLFPVKSRYYVSSLATPFVAAVGTYVTLAMHQHHHLTVVLKGKIGDYVHIFHEDSGEWLSVVVSLSKKNVDVRLVSPIPPLPTRSFSTTLFFAPLKKDATDFLLHKATELGVDTLIPLGTARTLAHNLQRSLKTQILIEAAEISGRLTIPRLLSVQSLATMHTYVSQMLLLFADETRVGVPLAEVLLGAFPAVTRFGFIVGPEGGFTDDERLLLRTIATPVSLGSYILKAETACVAALSCLLTLGDYNDKR